jgi:transcriptional regulator with XRE-family HTH domain
MPTPNVRDLLLEHHLAMQSQEGRKIVEKEFAEIIGINDKYYNHIYNLRRKPSPKIAKQLADFFDDPRGNYGMHLSDFTVNIRKRKVPIRS